MTALASEMPWMPFYPAKVPWHARITPRPAHEVLESAAARFPDRPCMNFLGRKYTYGEALDLVNRAIVGFQKLGVAKGTRVGLCLPNTPHYVICYFAVLKAGGTVVNFNPLYAEHEILEQCDDSGAEIMVSLDVKDIYRKVSRLPRGRGLRKIVVCPMRDVLPPIKGAMFALLNIGKTASIPDDAVHVSFRELTATEGTPAAVPIDPEKDLAVLQYTGGTTGRPKGAMLTHANVSANAEQVRLWSEVLTEGEERILAVLPFFHAFAMTVAMNLGIAIAAELILLPRFQIGQLLKAVTRTRPTLLPGVPTLFAAILAAPGLARHDLSSIRFCISGGAPLAVELKQQFEALTGCLLVEGYGLSEASPVLACNPVSRPNKAGSVGFPLPGTTIEIRSVEAPRTALRQGEKGEICAAGPQIMAGYWRRPAETAEAINNGMLRTGDVGYLDEEGYLFLVDRIKDVILCSGFKVYPRIIEEAIYSHPAVAETIVIGVPDAYRGETPKAFVRLKAGATLDQESLVAFLEDKLSPIEMPKLVEFRDELPKTAIGKLSKKYLVEEAAKAASAADGKISERTPAD